MIRVLIVDDSVFMRSILHDILSRDPGIEIVGMAADGIEALKQIRELSPDCITLDIQMPRMDGLATLDELKKLPEPPRVLMLSTLTAHDAELTSKALMLGATDFMLKPRNLSKLREIQDELVEKIKSVVSIREVATKAVRSDKPAQRIVVIGSSAGGPVMLDALVSRMAAGLPAAVVITQHMPEGFTAALSQRLNRIAAMPVKETENNDILYEGKIYVAKGGYHTIIMTTVGKDGFRGGRVTLSKSPPLHAVRPAVDHTFSSAARTFGTRTVSVILSGMGSDGGEGTLAVKTAGGTTMVVDEHDCLVYGMARSALERKAVDRVVPLDRLAEEIAQAVTTLE
ncbi:MAG: chemotaxis-specific protein-glutamate methyltransferase CheB [Methanomicrobiales archaeon]|nr:chemotaxis-specific protein-glutamate methyltransferase CheB [Methanomicrobiales archaeon]